MLCRCFPVNNCGFVSAVSRLDYTGESLACENFIALVLGVVDGVVIWSHGRSGNLGISHAYEKLSHERDNLQRSTTMQGLGRLRSALPGAVRRLSSTSHAADVAKPAVTIAAEASGLGDAAPTLSKVEGKHGVSVIGFLKVPPSSNFSIAPGSIYSSA